MRFPADDISSHEYEVKDVLDEGRFYKLVVFYLRSGESVEIKMEEVLKKTNLWMEPTESEPRREYVVHFEVAPDRDDVGNVKLYVSRVAVELGSDGS